MMIRNDNAGAYKAKHLSLSYAQKLWDEWELQSMVLTSFALQAFLLFAADLRRRNKSTVLRILLWLAYLSADYVAVFVLGHLTLRTDEPRHQLVLLWAPVLLLHLGGQETITAFSMEDNELWKRHLLGLVTQVAMAVYVVAKSWRRRSTGLLAPVVLMFVSGTLKYAERTWALRGATPATMKDDRMSDLHRTLASMQYGTRESSLFPQYIVQYDLGIFGREGWWLREKYADLVLAAGDSFDYCVNALMDFPLAPWFDQIIQVLADRIIGCRPPGQEDWFATRAFKMCEIQLSLMYDHLYTKVGLRYTQARWAAQPSWAVLSLVALPVLTLATTSSALALFAATAKKKDYAATDVVLTYILLAGAVALEVLSILTLTLSFRTHCFLREKLGDNWFTQAVFRLIQLARPYRKPLWSNQWAQYNVLARCIAEKRAAASVVGRTLRFLGLAGVVGRTLRFLGLETGNTKLSGIPDEFKELICAELDDPRRHKQFSHVRGQGILSLRGHRREGWESDLYKSIDKVDFSTSVVVWHVVTDLCFFLSNGGNGGRHMTLARSISNYLMYLVVEQQVMLSSEGHMAHRKVRAELKTILDVQSMEKVEEADDDAEAMKKMLEDGVQVISERRNRRFEPDSYETIGPVLPYVWWLAQALLGQDGMWELMASVWMEMLFHLASRCEPGFHARNLSTGGEFITHVRFLFLNRGVGWNFVLRAGVDE